LKQLKGRRKIDDGRQTKMEKKIFPIEFQRDLPFFDNKHNCGKVL
jgi:hypothetical protein